MGRIEPILLWIGIVATIIVIVAIVPVLGQNPNWAYNNDTKTMSILRGDGSVIMNLTLLTDNNLRVLKGEDRLVAMIEKEQFLTTGNSFYNQLELINNRNGENATKDITFKFKNITEIEVLDYVEVCNPFEDSNENGTFVNPNCTDVVSGFHLQNVSEWIEFDKNDLPDLNPITIGLFTDVVLGEDIEWIPTFYGVRITQWATWVESFNTDLELYFDMNDTTDLVYGIYNLTQVGAGGDVVFNQSGCVLGDCGHFISGRFLNTSGSDVENMTRANRTMNMWFNTINEASKPNTILHNSGDFTSEVEFEVSAGGTNGEIITYRGGLTEDTCNNCFDIPVVDTPHMLTIVRINDTSTAIYMDGVINYTSDMGNFSYQTTYDWGIGHKTDAGSSALGGTIDEIGWWNRTLTPSEISNLYNGGSGLTYDASAVPQVFPLVTINYPTNRTYGTIDIPLNFNVTLDQNGTMNYTLNGGILNITMSGDEGNLYGTEFNATNTSIGDGSYLFQAFGQNVSGSANNTERVWFSVDTIFPNSSINYPTPALKIASQTFQININASDTTSLESCVYNITDSNLNQEVAQTRIANCTDDKVVVSADGNYIAFLSVNDTANNQNITNVSFTIDTSTPTTSGGGGGGGTINIIQDLVVPDSICLEFRPSMEEAWITARKKGFTTENMKGLWFAFWDYVICRSASSIVPI